MLLIKTKIGPSKIHGIGLFAAEFIKKGTSVWEFTPGADVQFAPEEIEKLPTISRSQILNYSYIDPYKPGVYVFSADDARFVNHSATDPTLCDGGLMKSVAARDIEEGEELTCDYKADDLDYAKKINLPS